MDLSFIRQGENKFIVINQYGMGGTYLAEYDSDLWRTA
jgi:hypothetical protein